MNSLISWGNESRSFSVRETSELHRYLSASLVKLPSNKNYFDSLGWWKQFDALMFPIIAHMVQDLLKLQSLLPKMP